MTALPPSWPLLPSSSPPASQHQHSLTGQCRWLAGPCLPLPGSAASLVSSSLEWSAAETCWRKKLCVCEKERERECVSMRRRGEGGHRRERTNAQQHDRRAGCGGGRTPVICRPEAAGSLPELGVGEWMRLMLLCCTWKDERMGEEEGEEPLGGGWRKEGAAGGACIRRRRGGRCGDSGAVRGSTEMAPNIKPFFYCFSTLGVAFLPGTLTPHLAVVFLQGASGEGCCSWSHVDAPVVFGCSARPQAGDRDTLWGYPLKSRHMFCS